MEHDMIYVKHEFKSLFKALLIFRYRKTMPLLTFRYKNIF